MRQERKEEFEMQKNLNVAIFVLITLIYFSSVAGAALQEGLIGYWPFDEGTGETTADASGNGRALTKSGSFHPWANAANTRIGNSAFYRGPSTTARVYFYTDDVDFINGLSQFSLALWVKSTSASVNRGFVVGQVIDNKDEFFGFRYDSDGFDGGGTNVIKAGITTTEGTHLIETSDMSATADWQHLVFTWTSGGTISVYIDGVLDTLSHTGAAVAGTITEVTNFSIGRGPRSTSNYSWRGTIDDVRLYNRPLTQAEITLLASGEITDPISYEVELTSVEDLTTEVNANTEVTYTIRVTNSGTASDTITLAAFGDVIGTLNETSVTLDADASENVTLTIPGSELADAGVYAVTVTATSQGDSTKTASITTTTTIANYEVALEGVGDLTTEVDANTEVTYTIRVTNSGTASDTITLAASGGATGTLSETSVTLDVDASENVTLTIPGSELATPGVYEVTVTATSQGDDTKTASITTTTTIIANYEVALEGVGNLTTEVNASTEVTYTIKVTNSGTALDTINLAASGNANGTLSKPSVMLDAGASENVTLTIPENELATVDVYRVTVTATSDSDNTKTASIMTTTIIFSASQYGVVLTGVGNLTTETDDASDGVIYTIKVSNIGVNEDTIALTTSGSASATLSTLSVTLAAHTSSDVTLTIPGSELATAGVYIVTVTATSGDPEPFLTPPVSITTTTTISIRYGVALVGVGDLITSTDDASDGVIYTIKVINSGNVSDTITLTVSGDLTGNLSKSSVTLDADASEDVTLTIPESVLVATTGDYQVNVTAASQGDDTKTALITTLTTISIRYGVALVGVGNTTTTTDDVSAGVTYTIKVTNSGNVSDTIMLTTSGNATGTFSETPVTLDADASKDVTLTIPGSELATAGDYQVDVTATSQNDPEKTALITTLTTISIRYGVALVGVGDLITSTDDASNGVIYTIKVANNANVSDIITLTVSGDVAARLGITILTLDPGAREDVILTIHESVLATVGTYQIDVIATSHGDPTKTASITTLTTILPAAIPDPYNVALEGVGDLTTTTLDAGAGVQYTLRVSNTGSTSDLMTLATSGNATATLSKTTLPLEADASEDVTLTIPRSALATPGVYEVNVTATSQGDSRKMASITTTTTIRDPSRLPFTETVTVNLSGGTLAANGYAIVAHIGAIADSLPTSALPTLPSNVPQVNVDSIPDLENFLFRGGTIDAYVGVSTDTPDVIINEVMWAIDEHTPGTAAVIKHQWIELYNKSDQEVNLDKITLRFKPLSPAPDTNDLDGKKWTDRLSNVVAVFDIDTGTTIGWRLGNNHGQNGNSSASNAKEFISMYRRVDKLDNDDGLSSANWLPSTVISHRNHRGTPGMANTRGSVPVRTLSSPRRFEPPRSKVIINEVYNAADDEDDWIELRVREDMNLENWTLSYTRSDFTEVEILRFPDLTLEEGEVYLFVNKDPYESDLAVGQDFTLRPENQARGAGPHKYIVLTDTNKVEIPNYNGGTFYLILREAEGWERYGSRWKIHDVAGPARFARRTLHATVARDPYTNEIWETDVWPLNGQRTSTPNDRYLQTSSSYRFSVGNVWARNSTDPGWKRDGGRQVGFRGGIGYDRNVPSDKAKGTPGYHNYIIRGKNSDLRDDGQLVISELMLTTGGGSLPQWIEIHNTSKTDAVDLRKDTDDTGSRQGWTLEIENHDSGTWESKVRRLNVTVKFRDLGIQYIPPNQTILITSNKLNKNRHSGHFPDYRVTSIWEHAGQQFSMQNSKDLFLNAEGGFYIKLVDGSGEVVDKVGNLDGKRADLRSGIGFDDPYSWHWPTDMINDRRTSLIRIYDDGEPRPGTPDRDVEGSMRGAPAPLGTQVGNNADVVYSWVHAADTKYVNTLYAKKRNIYYGTKTDYGTPGYTRGTPLPVSLSYFHPALENSEVVIRWTTESELDNAGFNILRSETQHGVYKQINRQRIQGAGTTGERNTYKWIDTTAKPNVVYYYQIEDVSFTGERQTLAITKLRGLISPKNKLSTIWGKLKLKD